METITEDYCNFENAKLLKDKGFYSEDCFAFYRENGEIGFLQTFGDIADYDSETCVIAPTLQMAMKWLREKHNIVVEPFIRENAEYVWFIHRIETMFNKKYLVFCWGSKNNKYERYELACEAAINYCLKNLI